MSRFTKRDDRLRICRAAREGDIASLEACLKEGIPIDSKDPDDYYEKTPLHWACEEGKVEVAKLLLDRGAAVDVRDKYDRTPLHYATSKEVAELLLSYGAIVDAKDTSKNTPLILASYSGRQDVVQLLVQKGADPNLQDKHGSTALMDACRKRHGETARILLEGGADINKKNNWGETAMDVSKTHEIKEIIKAHIAAGPTPKVSPPQPPPTHPTSSQQAPERAAQMTGPTSEVSPPEEGHFVRVLYNYTPDISVSDQLKLLRGQLVQFLSCQWGAKGWWLGRMEGNVGLFPSNYVELVEESEVSQECLPQSDFARVLYSYDPNRADVLPISEGQTVEILSQSWMEGWSLARAEGRVGLVPCSYIEPLPRTQANTLVAGAAQEHIVAEESISISKKPQCFDWKEMGLTVYIPENALPPHTGQCTMIAKSFLPQPAGPYKFPQGTEPVSGVFEIFTSTPLTKTVSIRMQHCLPSEGLADAVFTQSSNGPPHVFTVVSQGAVVYNVHGMVKLALSKSVQLAIVNAVGCATTFHAQLYLESSSLTTHYIYFTLMRSLLVYTKAIEQEYYGKNDTKQLTSLPEVVLSEGATEVVLNLPKEGITTKENWKITPHPAQYPPMISKSSASYSIPSKQIAATKLSVKWNGPPMETLPPFQYSMGLRGTENPTAFLIHFSNQGSPNPLQTNVSTSAPSKGFKLSSDKHQLPGVEVVAEDHMVITAEQEHTPKEMSKLGVTVRVPEHSLPPETRKSEIQVKSCIGDQSGPVVFPPGVKPASAICEISASSSLSKQAELEIEHCERESHPAEMHFVTADASGPPPYKLEYTQQKSEFTKTSGKMKVALSPKRLLIAICKKVTSKFSSTKYQALLYFRSVSTTQKELHFVLAKDLKVYTEAVQQHFQSRASKEVLKLPITFTKESIHLVLSEDGVTTPEGWSILPVIYPLKINKKQVDQYKSNQNTLPSCQLMAEWRRGTLRSIPPLRHRMRMKGVETTSFLISLSEQTPSRPLNLAKTTECIQTAAEQLVQAATWWEDNVLVKATKRIASHMEEVVKLARQSATGAHPDSSQKMLTTVKEIGRESNAVLETARKIVSACADKTMSKGVEDCVERISTILTQLDVGARAKATYLHDDYSEHAVAEAIQNLADNADNLQKSISDLLNVSETASIRVNREVRGRMGLHWKKRTPRKLVTLAASNAVTICDILKKSGFSTAGWESLAPRLGVMDTMSIWTVHPRDPFLCLYDVICQWLHSDPQASWEKLAAEVSKVEGYGPTRAQTVLRNAETGDEQHLPG